MSTHAKIILWVGGTVAVVLLVTLAIVAASGKKSSTGKISIATPQGTVQTNNFTAGAQAVYPTNVVFQNTSNDYSISAATASNSFNIALLALPLQKSRTEAEAAFISQLGISQSDACKLTVDLGVPYSVDQNASGVNYGLSFCPGSKALPAN